MGILEMVLIGVGLAMDAFAVSVCKGLGMRKINYKHALITAVFFGGFQALMPFIGWLLGTQFEKYITAVDHWIAFILLLFIGGKMVIEVIKERDSQEEICEEKFSYKQLTAEAVATSIDALAVGITFAFLNTGIALPMTIIGVVTFVIAFGGVVIGNRFGAKFKSKAELAGGIILILIGVKILVEHLMGG